jgi:tetratricopeptide (TPR) repeat protein
VRRTLIAIACGCAALAIVCGCDNKLSALKRAARLAKKQRHSEAVEAYKHYIELVGNSPETAYERAEAYYQIGRLYTYRLREWALGRHAFQEAAALRPDYADPQIHLGIMYMSVIPTQPAQAEEALRRALESRPEITEYSVVPGSVHRPRVILADLARERGQLNEAIRQLYIFEHYSDNDADDWHELGRLFAREHDDSKALFYFKRAYDALGEAERGMPRYMGIRTGLIDAYAKNGSLAEAQALLDEALDVLKQIDVYYRNLADWQRDEAPGLRDFILDTRRELLRQVSVVCTARGDYSKALDAIRQLQLLTPQSDDLLLDAAKLCAMKGDFERAREELDKFRRRNPDDTRVLQTEASIFYEEHNYEASLKAIEAYAAASSRPVSPQALRAVALVRAGLADEGIAQLEKLCRENPNFWELQLSMAEALAAAGRPQQALWWLGRAIDTGLIPPYLFQANPTFHSLLDEPGASELLRKLRYRLSLRQRVHEAEDLVYRGDTSRGLASLERLCQQNADIPYTTFALARAYVFIGKPDEAFPLLIECARAGLFNPSALRRDKSLTELHDDPRFAQVLEAIEQPWPRSTPH